MSKEIHIPIEVNKILRVLRKANFEAYLVGGCVRDILLGREPKDWDITTNAKPDEVQKLFPDSVYENQFGTVGVKIPTLEEVRTPTAASELKAKIVEITTFRKEGKYTDKRHPDSISFAKTVEEDLSRRDFTINSLALGWSSDTKDFIVDGLSTENETKIDLKNLQLVDPYGGQGDLKAKLIKTVGKPEERFTEDALRMMRAIRFASELGFKIDGETGAAILHHSGLLEAIAKERIRDEFQKIILSSRAKDGVQILEDYGLLRHIMPELREGIDVGQNKHHIYSVWEHNLRALDYAVSKNYPLHIRLASLLHDVGKPKSKRGNGPDSTFYGHDIIGGKMAVKIMDRLHFNKDLIEQVAHLVRYHLFYYNVGEVTPSGVRRFIARVGPENIDDLIKVREADRIGSGVPKAVPYKLRHLLFMIEKVKRDPISPKMLLVKGDDLMRLLDIPPGPKIGAILSILLEEVIEDPLRNTIENLELRIKILNKLSDKELHQLAKKAKSTKDEFEAGEEQKMKQKHYVK
ncbi:MAG: HD domain-containing protein [bacterium]|nr:HD domain-containing protein [bacterium]